MYCCVFLHVHVSSFDLFYFILIYLFGCKSEVFILFVYSFLVSTLHWPGYCLTCSSKFLFFSRAPYTSWYWSSMATLAMKGNILYMLLKCYTLRIRIRIRVYAGPRGIFACLNHDKDQPCRAVQQSAWHQSQVSATRMLIHSGKISSSRQAWGFSLSRQAWDINGRILGILC